MAFVAEASLNPHPPPPPPHLDCLDRLLRTDVTEQLPGQLVELQQRLARVALLHAHRVVLAVLPVRLGSAAAGGGSGLVHSDVGVRVGVM